MNKKLVFVTLAVALLPLAALARGVESGSGSGSTSTQTSATEPRSQEAEIAHSEAESQMVEQHKELEKKRAALAAKAGEKKDAACANRSAKLEFRGKASSEHRTGLLEKYTRAAVHVEKLITRAKAAGVDTSKLEADLVALKTKTANFGADFDAFTSLVVSAQALDCTATTDVRKAAKAKIKTAHEKLQADRADIHDFYKNTLRPDMVVVIKAIKAKHPTTTPNATKE